jgi:hypothetical protein
MNFYSGTVQELERSFLDFDLSLSMRNEWKN